ncbi:capsule assembly Wzi family protein [Spirosoma fluminis]
MISVGLALASLYGNAQTAGKKTQYWVEAGLFLATAETNPFWVRSNQYGEVPLESPGFTVRAQARGDFAPLADKKFSYGYGARGVVNAGATNQFLLSEAYGKVRYGAFEFYAGRRREVFGLADSALSAGSYIWSGNALPMPKLQLSIPNYTPILKNGLLAIRGNYAHGWFGQSDSVANYYLHQKSFYVRIGKPDWRIKIQAGFNHQVQWGGTVLYPRFDSGVRITQFGSDWQSYVFVVTGKSLYELDTLTISNNAASAEGGNRVGNHLGTFDLGIDYEDEQNHWFIYRQSIYEAGALFYLNNIADGLTGLSLTRKQAKRGIQRIVLEYLHTSNQGGPLPSGRAGGTPQLRGYEDYFNNGRYIDGWVYKRQTIGTPFIMPLNYTTGLPQNLAKNPHYIVNNRVNALTLGVQSRYGALDLLTRISVSNNLGNYTTSLNYTQLSVQQQLMFTIKQNRLTATIGYDGAGVLNQTIGISLLASRSF